jgi:excisionase family DNA binding protein
VNKQEKPVLGRLVSVAEAAKYLHIGLTNTYKYINDGTLTFVRYPKGKLLIDTAVLDDFIRMSTVYGRFTAGNV